MGPQFLKKSFLGAGIFIVIGILGGLYAFLVNLSAENSGSKLRYLEISNNRFEIEIADTVLARRRGLSGRDFLAENKGMLFIFGDVAVRSFWMAGMKFSLDIVWIKDDKVIGFEENAPPVLGIGVPLYYSPEPVDKVLEINAGLVKKLGIKAGDMIKF